MAACKVPDISRFGSLLLDELFRCSKMGFLFFTGRHPLTGPSGNALGIAPTAMTQKHSSSFHAVGTS